MTHLKKSILFIFIGITIFVLLEIFAFKPTKINRDVYKAMKEAETAGPYQEVIISDSVGRQLFPTGRGTKSLYLTSNQAIAMVGQYIMIDKYFSRFPGKVKNMIAIFHPFSLTNNLDQVWTFNYFLLPFFSKENDRYFSPLIYSLMEKCKYCYLYRMEFIKKIIEKHLENFQVDFSTLDNHPFDFNGFKTTDRIYLAPVTIEYLKKMADLCRQNKIRFHLLCPPLSENYLSDFSFIKIQIQENGLTDLFKEFFDKMIFLQKKAFKHDGIHYATHYHKRNRKAIIRNMRINSIDFPYKHSEKLPPLQYKLTLPSTFLDINDLKPIFVDSLEGGSFLLQKVSKNDFEISTYSQESRGSREKVNILKLVTIKYGASFHPVYDLHSAGNFSSVGGSGIKVKPGDMVYFTICIKGNFSNNVANEIFISEVGLNKKATKFFLSQDWIEYKVCLEMQKNDDRLYAGIFFIGNKKGEVLEIKEPKVFINSKK